MQWSAEFFDGREREHAEEMATPWFGINHDCYREIWSELERTWHRGRADHSSAAGSRSRS